MECKSFVLCYMLYLSLQICISVDQASFYGNSYISIPFKEARSSTDIHFKFRTHLSDALILLVAGTIDYCIVELENSRIKVNINLGAGESELLSPSNIKLSDFKWHDITIERREANLSMVIDKSYKVQKHLPGKFFELNIHYGLFVADHRNKNNTDIFFGHVEKFRGCLSELKYNDINVLEQARHRQSQTVVQGITWSCAAEFEATIDRPISFIEDDSYMIIRHTARSKEIKIHFEIRTIAVEGLLFYNIGHLMKPDYLIIDIINSNVGCVLKIGERTLKINNNQNISDGEWHKIDFKLNSAIIELSVDKKTTSEKNGHNQVFQFSESSYIGGLEVSKRFRATSKGCGKSCDISFKGCIRHVSVQDVKKGLPDAHATEGLLPGCMWHYPCLQNPCENNAICVQQGLDSFQCQCKEKLCVKLNYTEGYKVFSKNSLATELELLSVQPLEVLEGESEIITTNNLNMILDYHKYGIKDTGINFFIIEGPEHGSITIDIWPHEKNSFSLYDVARDKVHYIHDGSEYQHDSIVLEVEFSPADTFILPVYLQGKFRFSLSVTTVPKNDAPILEITDSTVLRIVQGTEKLITDDIFKLRDPDTSPSDIVYTILKSDCGHFEHVKSAGDPISSFTQEDIENEKIIFVDRSSSSTESYISLQVSDGIETSPVYKLRLSVTPQYWRLQNNTGLVVLHQTACVLTPYNLSFTSNVANADYRAQFKIVKKPVYGFIEVEKGVNLWEISDTFSSSELKQHRVRYRHTNAKPEIDEFQFKTSLDKSSVYTFRITFAKCTLYNVKTKHVLLDEIWELPLSTEFISFQTQPLKTLTTSIYYVLSKAPEFGYLFSSVSKYRLKPCDSFTEEDLVLQNIYYRLFQKTYSHVEDRFDFIVRSPGCSNITGNLTFKYSPSKEMRTKVVVTLKDLFVEEGAVNIITSSYLYFQADFITDLLFNITKKPKNGILQVKKNDIIQNDTNYFTTSELKSNMLFYVHDGSETESDSFQFMALSVNNENFEYVDTFNIKIQLKNDNSPLRAVDKVFHVVVGGERLITGNDLKYTDADLGTPTSAIIYTCRESSNGNFYNIKNQSTKITEFTQEDLDNNRILFKHKGPEYGKVRLWVTDGQFHVNGLLEIQASAPFIHVTMNQKLIVEQGKIVVISNKHLSYSTNLFASDEDVIYMITQKPAYGKIVLSDSLKIIKNFTQEDVRLGRVSYINEVSTVNADDIGIRIRCKDAINVAQIGVLMLPSIYWEPLEVINARKLLVEESTSALITKKILEVSQTNVPASSITYHISEMPEYGYISILSDTKNGNEPINVVSFTQDFINENRVLYIQSSSNQTKDKILFNVTNGIVWETNLILPIEIIPERIYLGTNDLTVNEGGVTEITPAYLFVLTDYYKSKITSYVIKHDVQHGCIQVYKRCTKLNGFSQKELNEGVVRYAHDGTENLRDQLTLIGETGQKKTVPVVLTINAIPVNDQKPRLVNNTGLIMWEGGVAVITKEMLAAVDDDRPEETLKYQVQSCWWGSVSLISDIATSLNYFTQEFINKNMVVFRHHNGTEAKFKFNVSDGLHTTKDYIFYIKTKPVQVKLYSRPLHIFPLQRKYLTSNHLYTFISDTDRTVYYEVVTPPALGRLMMESDVAGIFKVVSTFTQHDLNNSRIFYEHTHQFSDLYANDSFVFNIKAYLAPSLTNQVLKIDISVSSGGLDAYVTIPKIVVDEGGITNILLNLSGVVSFLENHAGLRSPIIHASASPPLHGQVFLKNNVNMTTFTQQELEEGKVYYEHDHSDSLGDNVHFSLYLIPGYIVLCNITVPVFINPINDQPFNLVTPAPSLKVVQGENHTITRRELATEDADTPPSKLKYDLISGPSHGKLVLLPQGVPIMYFTQADIDQNRLLYIHDGTVLKDSFHFRVWDEKFRPQFTLFNIIVTPINITISAGLPVYLQQGSDVVFLSEKQIFIETNANKNKVRYTVKRPPKHGVLYVKDNPSLSFTQVDLSSENVMYLQTDMTTANDSFKLNSEILAGSTSFGNEVEIIIRVQPLMQIHNFTTIVGQANRITLSVLDATPLAKLTNSNPRYTVVHMPKYGQLRKVIRSSGEKRNILDAIVTTFTHEEVQSGLIYLVIKDIEVPWYGIQEKLVFILATSIFQPAIGELKINIVSSISNEIYSTLAGPSDPAGHEGGLHLASPNMTRDYLLIVSMVVGVVILGVAVIVIIKCRSLEVEELNKEEQCLQPIPLPRPPDRLMASPPPLKQHIDGYTPPLSTALPQCKVTPLSRSEQESNVCYPYGVEEQPDDWSSCDASDPPCPSKNIMLRRNQYWV